MVAQKLAPFVHSAETEIQSPLVPKDTQKQVAVINVFH